MYNENHNTPQLQRTEIKAVHFYLTLYSPRLFDFDNFFVTYFNHSEFSFSSFKSSL